MSALLTQSPGDTVQTRTGKVDPARKFKCTTAVRDDRPATVKSLAAPSKSARLRIGGEGGTFPSPLRPVQGVGPVRIKIDRSPP